MTVIGGCLPQSSSEHEPDARLRLQLRQPELRHRGTPTSTTIRQHRDGLKTCLCASSAAEITPESKRRTVVSKNTQLEGGTPGRLLTLLTTPHSSGRLHRGYPPPAVPPNPANSTSGHINACQSATPRRQSRESVASISFGRKQRQLLHSALSQSRRGDPRAPSREDLRSPCAELVEHCPTQS